MRSSAPRHCLPIHRTSRAAQRLCPSPAMNAQLTPAGAPPHAVCLAAQMHRRQQPARHSRAGVAHYRAAGTQQARYRRKGTPAIQQPRQRGMAASSTRAFARAPAVLLALASLALAPLLSGRNQLRNLEPVPGPSHGLKIARRLCIRLNLLPDAPDIDVHRARGYKTSIAPDGVQQVVATKYTSRMTRQVVQQAELG